LLIKNIPTQKPAPSCVVCAPAFFLRFLVGKSKLLLTGTKGFFFKKKAAHAYLGARIFSKSFGGKIEHGQTNVNKETTFTKKLTQHSGLENLFFYS